MKEKGIGAAHCHVRGGSLNQEGFQVIERSLTSHNLINQIDLVVPHSESARVETAMNDAFKGSQSYILEDFNLSTLLSLVLSLTPDERSQITCYADHQQVDHEDSISIVRGMLHLKLTSEVYYSSGMSGKLSQFCTKSGVSSKNNQFKLFKLDFNLREFQEMINKKDMNYVRLLWFAQNVYQGKKYQFIISHAEPLVELLDSRQDLNFADVTPIIKKTDLGVLKIPALKPIPRGDETWASDTLEWIIYSSQDDCQLGSFDNTDSYISRYREMNEENLVHEAKLTRFSISNGLFNGNIDIQRLLNGPNGLLKTGVSWFTLANYGLKDSNVSYGLKNEHGYVENGENDCVLLKSGEEFVIWDVVAFGDSR